MNFKKIHTGEKPVLVNFDNVCEIHERMQGAELYFNTMTTSEDQASIYADETLEEIEVILAL